MNMATLYKLPIIFVVENNLWAIGMYHPRATAPSYGDDTPQIWKKGPAFGMPGVLVDGMDVLKATYSPPPISSRSPPTHSASAAAAQSGPGFRHQSLSSHLSTARHAATRRCQCPPPPATTLPLHHCHPPILSPAAKPGNPQASPLQH